MLTVTRLKKEIPNFKLTISQRCRNYFALVSIRRWPTGFVDPPKNFKSLTKTATHPSLDSNMNAEIIRLIMENSKKILVTGGAGFIGSHLCKKLINAGNEVICVDNFFTGRKANLTELHGNANFEIIRHDITYPLVLEIDEIYNLACPASPAQYQKDPVQTTKTNVHGAINMLGLAKRTKARILQASTSEVYGDPEVHPQPEWYQGKVNFNGIRSCYDEGKRCAETLFFDYKRQHGVDTTIARIFNTFGPNMDMNDGRVVSNFIVQALTGKNITIFGDGTQTRSFCFVDDLVLGLIALMEEKTSPGPVNLGNPHEITVSGLATMILQMTGSKSKLKYVDIPEDDPIRRQPDISLAIDGLGWQPKVSLADGLKITIDYFENLLTHENMVSELVDLSVSSARG